MSARFLPLVILLVAILPAGAGAATFRVCASACPYTNLQDALDAAQPGDTILLRPGETYVGNYRLRARAAGPAGAYIVVRSDAPAGELPGEGERLVPPGRPGANVSLASLARIVGQGGPYKSQPVLRADPGANHFRFQFIEFDGTANLGYESLIALGSDDPQAVPPYNIVLDRVYIHGHFAKGQKRGVSLNGRQLEVINSYISDIKAVNADSQALAGWNGPGPFRIVNNYIEGAGENIMFGGGRPASPGLIPSDIEIRRNHIAKPTAWREAILAAPASVRATPASGGGWLGHGAHYFRVVALLKTGTATAVSAPSPEVAVTVVAGDRLTLTWGAVPAAEAYRIYRGPTSGGQLVYTETGGAATSYVYTGANEVSGTPPTTATRWVAKNLIELKNAQRVVIDGNLLENNWAGAQAGYAIALTPRNHNGAAPWAAVRDITFTNNVLRHAAGAINILGYDDTEAGGSALTERITIRNNLFYDINPANWGGGLTRCFMVGQGASRVVFDRNTIDHGTSTLLSAYGRPMPHFVFTNNVAQHGKYGVMGASSSTGNPTLAAFFPAATFAHNVLAGGNPALYPPGNSFPTLAVWHASFVDPAAEDYRLRSSSPFYAAGSSGSTPGADIAAIDAARGLVSTPPVPTPINRPPTADAGGPYAVAVNRDLTVDGSGSSDPENGIATYQWSWGEEIVIHAGDVPSSAMRGDWQKSPIAGAAGGTALVNPNRGVAKIQTPLASPSSYVEVTFTAAAGVPYYVWFRMQADGNHYSNDSVYVQFSGAVDAAGAPVAPIGSATALSYILEQGRGLGVAGWGWTDSAYDGVAAPIYFARPGEQRLRLQPREDGVRIDQIVISAAVYAARMPGLTRDDATVVSRSLGTSSGVHATRRFARPGVYPLTLRVVDSGGASSIDVTTVTVSSTAAASQTKGSGLAAAPARPREPAGQD